MGLSIHYSATITSSGVIDRMPEGRMANIQCSADITIAFWNPAANAYGATEDLLAPGGQVYCPNSKAQVTTATTSAVTVTLLDNL